MAHAAPVRNPDRLPSDLERGIYLPTEAALFAGVPKVIVRRWLQLERGEIDVNAGADQHLVSFLGLISLRAIAAFRKLGLRLDQIHRGTQHMRDVLDAAYPLALEDFKTDGVSRYFSRVSDRLAVDGGRVAAQELVGAYLTDVVYTPVGGRRLATSWDPPGVSLNPRIQRGAPCVAGSRVRIVGLKKYADAGDSPALLAELFLLDLAAVQAALDWYAGLGQPPG